MRKCEKMRLLIFHAAVFLIVALMPALGQDVYGNLPNGIKTILDRDYPGWKFSEVPNHIHNFFQNYNVRFDPNFIWGDFDGDGVLDYATQITFKEERIIIVFFRKDGVYKKFALDSYDRETIDIYLWVHKKGSKDYDYDLEKEFFYQNDSIGVNYYEKAGVSYIFENGTFRSIATSD